MNSKNFVFECKTKWEQVSMGISRQILGYDDKLMQVKVEFQAGTVAPKHAHTHSQTTYVVSGVFEFTVGDEKQTVQAGDGIYIAPDVMHGVVCIKAGILLDSFSPMREDFLI